MKQCYQCGAVLEAGQNICPACGAVQSRAGNAHSGSHTPPADEPARRTGEPGRRGNDAGRRAQTEDHRTALHAAADKTAHTGRADSAAAQSAEADEDYFRGIPQSNSTQARAARAFAAVQNATRAGVPDALPEKHAAPETQPSREEDYLLDAEPPAAVRHRKKKDHTVLVLGILALLLALLLAAASIATTVLYRKYNAENFYDSLDKALLSADTAALSQLVVGDGVEVTNENLAALCSAFSVQENVDSLMAQLRAQAAGTAGDDVQFSSLTLTREKVFLGYANYRLAARPVSLQVPMTAQNPLLTVNGASRTGQSTADGILYTGFFPGQYTCVLTGQTALGVTMTGPSTNVMLFDSTKPVPFDGNLPIADITVSGSPSDAAVIAVDGTTVAQRSVNGVVTLPQVGVGSTISLTYTTEYGATTTASVQFTDKTATSLAFANFVTQGGVPAESDMTALLGAFYASYLDVLNNQDASKLTRATDLMLNTVKSSMGSDDNKDSVYMFMKAVPKMDSVAQGEYASGDTKLPSITLNASFQYTLTNRTNKKDSTKTDLVTCELVYQNGGWKVNRMVGCSQSDFDANKLTAFA